jgi:hypothetical protein
LSTSKKIKSVVDALSSLDFDSLNIQEVAEETSTIFSGSETSTSIILN